MIETMIDPMNSIQLKTYTSPLIKKTGWFIRWPVLWLLLLQVTMCFFLEESKWIFILLVVWIITGCFIFRRYRKLKSFAAILFLFFISQLYFFWCQNPVGFKFINKKAVYIAKVISSERLSEGRSALILDLQELEWPIKKQIKGRVRLVVGNACIWPEHDLMRFKAKIQPFRNYQNPGVFDYRSFMRRRNIWGQAYVMSCETLESVSGRSLSIRQKIRQRIFNGFKDKEFESVMMALSLGSSTLDFNTKELIRKNGLSHLFAISGTHFSVMLAMVYFVFVWIFNRFSFLYLKWPRQKIVAVLTILMVFGFMWLAASKSSVHRAGLMATVVLVATLSERKLNWLYLVFVSMALQLLLDPLILFEVGFQLSYLCVLFLVIVYRPVYFVLKKKCRRWPRFWFWALQSVLVSWLLQLALMPYVLFKFGSVPLLGFIHNLWAIPFFQFLLVPVGAVSMVASGFGCGSFFVELWQQLLQLFFFVLQASGSDGFEVSGYSPHLVPVLLFYSVLFLSVLSKSKICLKVGTCLVILSLCFVAYQNTNSNKLVVTQLDVGQGDASLIEKNGKSVLIDVGGHRYFDVGQKALLPYFRHRWIRKVDVVVLTHSDFDHYGSLFGLLGGIEIGEVWVNGGNEDDELFASLLWELKKHNIPWRQVYVGDQYRFDSDVTLNVLLAEEGAHLSDNDRSLVLQLNLPKGRVLFTGDITKMTERKLVKKYGSLLKSKILKVSHHGSKTSSGLSFLKAVDPELALIGVGQRSHFGHPHGKVLDRFKRLGIPVRRTDLEGAIRLEF